MNPSIHDHGTLHFLGISLEQGSHLKVKFTNGSGIRISHHDKEMQGLILRRTRDGRRYCCRDVVAVGGGGDVAVVGDCCGSFGWHIMIGIGGKKWYSRQRCIF